MDKIEYFFNQKRAIIFNIVMYFFMTTILAIEYFIFYDIFFSIKVLFIGYITVIFSIAIYFINIIHLEIKSIIITSLPLIGCIIFSRFIEAADNDKFYLFCHTSILYAALYFNFKVLIVNSAIFNSIMIFLFLINNEVVVGEVQKPIVEFIKRITISNFGIIILLFLTKWGNRLLLLLKKQNNEIKKHNIELENTVKERTNELHYLNNRLKELDRLKSDFIANVTHDFRSPLMVIQNISDLALKYCKTLDDEHRDNYETILMSSMKLRNTIDQLLDLARMDSDRLIVNISKINVNNFLNQIYKYFFSSVNFTKISMNLILPDTIIEIFSDPEKLEQIVTNLVSNAIKFVDTENGIIDIELQDHDDYIIISIKDNGIGIDPSKLTNIFNRFEQAYDSDLNKFKGTGIGLAFARQLTLFLKGDLWADSEGLNKGAEFNIKLFKGKGVFKDSCEISDNLNKYKIKYNSMIQAEINEKNTEEIEDEYIRDRNKHGEYDIKKALILIIDENMDIINIVMKYLFQNGFLNFIAATDGLDAIDKIYRYSPDLIISDYNKPVFSQNDFYEIVHKNEKFKSLPFVFISEVNEEVIINTLKQKGVVSFISKPISENELISKVEMHLINYMEITKSLNTISIDELSGLYNRNMVKELFHKELSKRYFSDISIVMIDVDHYRKINEKYGHFVGDKILMTLGKIIKDHTRKFDIAGRYRADKFLILLRETNMNEAAEVAKNLSGKINKTAIKIDDQNEINITVSIGISSLKDNKRYIQDLLNFPNIEDIWQAKDKIDSQSKIDIEEYKSVIAEILIRLSDEACYRAKKTKCNDCGFHNIDDEQFVNNKCPECGSNKIVYGRNKVYCFTDIKN